MRELPKPSKTIEPRTQACDCCDQMTKVWPCVFPNMLPEVWCQDCIDEEHMYQIDEKHDPDCELNIDLGWHEYEGQHFDHQNCQ